LKGFEMTNGTNRNVSNWWRFAVGVLIGALAPSLIAWGSMSAKIENNKLLLDNKVNVSTFQEYKDGNTKLLQAMSDALSRIECKIDKQIGAK